MVILFVWMICKCMNSTVYAKNKKKKNLLRLYAYKS